MLLILDNYDSFTYNLVHGFHELGVAPFVLRNDEKSTAEVLALRPRAIIISPGPCDPARAGISVPLVLAAAEHRIPLLGVCLGHQAIGAAFGGHVSRAPEPRHGKVSAIAHDGTGVLKGLPQPFQATRYHSLVVDRARWPSQLVLTAEADGLAMALRHQSLPLHGVQFHPESIASEAGHRILANFLDEAALAHGPVPDRPPLAA